jgi:hypothetical protein
MRIFFSSLVAASLLIHAVLGCCWHHAQDLSGCGDTVAEQAVDAGCCHHDHGDQDHGQPSHAPCKGHCQGLCTYLPVQKTQLDHQQLHAALDFAIIAPATGDAQIAAGFCLARAHETAAQPPLRLHLFHQILLI